MSTMSTMIWATVRPALTLRTITRKCPNRRRIGFWWGHDTLEDQEARRKAEEKKNLVVWNDPDKKDLVSAKDRDKENQIAIMKRNVYLPVRIENEQLSLELGFDRSRMSLVDWAYKIRYPYFAWYTDPEFYATEQRIKAYKRLIMSQSFVLERLTKLGPDLAAAHFLIARGCAVKFQGIPGWMRANKKNMTPDTIPTAYEPGLYVEAIDAAYSQLIYEGLQNIKGLLYLKYLDLSFSPMIDEWCLDRISGEFSGSLEYLDISGCYNVNFNGLECLWRLKKLKVLVLRDMEHITDLKIICLMLVDALPDLEIRGVDYLDTSLLEGTEHEDLLKDKDLFLTADSNVENDDQTKLVEPPKSESDDTENPKQASVPSKS